MRTATEERRWIRTLFETYAAGLEGRNAAVALELRRAIVVVFDEVFDETKAPKTDERSDKSYATNDDDCG